MTPEHKQAIARGREAGAAVRRYLDALASESRRGRRMSPERLQQRLAAVTEQIPQANALRRVELIQERLDLEAALAAAEDDSSADDLESAFIEVVAEYSSRKGLSYAAWREAGVKPDVLRRAGLTRSG